jgi:hypothetical protein
VRYQAHAFDNQCVLANEQPNEQLCEADLEGETRAAGRSIHPLAASLDRSLHVCERAKFTGGGGVSQAVRASPPKHTVVGASRLQAKCRSVANCSVMRSAIDANECWQN